MFWLPLVHEILSTVLFCWIIRHVPVTIFDRVPLCIDYGGIKALKCSTILLQPKCDTCKNCWHVIRQIIEMSASF